MHFDQEIVPPRGRASKSIEEYEQRVLRKLARRGEMAMMARSWCIGCRFGAVGARREAVGCERFASISFDRVNEPLHAEVVDSSRHRDRDRDDRGPAAAGGWREREAACVCVFGVCVCVCARGGDKGSNFRLPPRDVPAPVPVADEHVPPRITYDDTSKVLLVPALLCTTSCVSLCFDADVVRSSFVCSQLASGACAMAAPCSRSTSRLRSPRPLQTFLLTSRLRGGV